MLRKGMEALLVVLECILVVVSTILWGIFGAWGAFLIVAVIYSQSIGPLY